MAQNNKVKTLKKLETASMWCAIASLLVFFANLIAFVAMLVMYTSNEDWTTFANSIFYLTIITEFTSLALILAWMVMAIIEMIMIGRNKELGKYHHGSFTTWILAMIISLGFLFLSLLIFFVSISKESSQAGVYVSFGLYIAATVGSTMYISSVARSLRRIKYGE